MAIDLSKATKEDLLAIHNEVLRNLALQTKAGNIAAEGHDSHGSNHSNNKIVANLSDRIAEIMGGGGQ